MVKYKNIRVKMKGGKSRLQRVKVLASGKYKFVKNLKRKVTRRKSRVTRRKTRRKRNNPKRRVNRTAKGKSLVQSVTKIAKAGSLLVPVAIAATSPGDARHKVIMYTSFVSGFDLGGGKAKFKLDRLLTGWGPYLGVSAASKIVGKINGLISRI